VEVSVYWQTFPLLPPSHGGHVALQVDGDFLPASPPQPAPTSTQLVAFTDPVSGPTTPDLRDVDDQTVHINTADELIWAADGTRFAEFIAVGNFIAYHHKTDVFFQIRFGTRDGQRRAYIGWPDHHLAGRTPTIADLWVDEGGGLRIAETDVAIPGM
jgi:hypothetical protein